MIFVSALVMLNLGGLSVAWRSAGWLVNRNITIAALVRVWLHSAAILTGRVVVRSGGAQTVSFDVSGWRWENLPSHPPTGQTGASQRFLGVPDAGVRGSGANLAPTGYREARTMSTRRLWCSPMTSA